MQASAVRYAGFNHDASLFLFGTDDGCFMGSTYLAGWKPLERINSGPTCCVDILRRTNMLAVVRGNTSHLVHLWSLGQDTPSGVVNLAHPVLSVKLCHNRVMVCTEYVVRLYQLSDLRCTRHIDTCPNPNGLLAIAASLSRFVFACLGTVQGTVCVCVLDEKKQRTFRATPTTKNDVPVTAIALDASGERVAMAAGDGEARVWQTSNGKLMCTLIPGSESDRASRRRGSRTDLVVRIESVCFSRLSTYVALVVTSTCTVESDGSNEDLKLTVKSLQLFVLPIGTSDAPRLHPAHTWHLPTEGEAKGMVATFAYEQEHALVVASLTGMAYSIVFEPPLPLGAKRTASMVLETISSFPVDLSELVASYAAPGCWSDGEPCPFAQIAALNKGTNEAVVFGQKSLFSSMESNHTNPLKSTN